MFGDERDRINVDERKDKFVALELIADFEKFNLINWLLAVAVKHKLNRLNQFGQEMHNKLADIMVKKFKELLSLKVKDLFKDDEEILKALPKEVAESGIPADVFVYALLTTANDVISEYLKFNANSYKDSLEKLTGIEVEPDLVVVDF